jgi:hypothetical protein
MATKINCWEFKKCGRESGGSNTAEYNTCPAATETSVHGINGGKNGGRICWAIAGTLSNEKIKGTFAREIFSCLNCDFFKLVRSEEKVNSYEILTPIQLDVFLANRRKVLSNERENLAHRQKMVQYRIF